MNTEETRQTREEAPADNARALDELLAKIEVAASQDGHLHGGEYLRSKGARFETLTRVYFRNEPTYKDLFAKIEPWADWAKAHPELCSGRFKDTGIDLVATLADGTGYAAVQCKFYARDARVGKADIDSFIAAANRECFKLRFLVATNETWTDEAKEALKAQKDPITLVTRGDLGRSAIDWANYLDTGKVDVRPPRRLRDYQRRAVEAVLKGLSTAERGKLIMACGTGKTFTAMKIAQRMAPSGFVMVLVPSLALLSQTLTDWKQNAELNAFAVCSDASTGTKDVTEEDNLLSISELNYPATTDARTLAAKARADVEKGGRMTVIFSTYQSIGVVGRAQKEFGLPELDLVICDEAHRTAAGYYLDEGEDRETDFTRVHDKDFIRAKKRLYMTATPKVYGETAKAKQRNKEVVLYSMDDEDVFGKTLYEISFRSAVTLDCLCDYKVIVLTVPESMGKALVTEEDLQRGEVSSSNAVKIVGAWRALAKKGLESDVSLGGDVAPMRRAVGFAQYIEPKAGDGKRVSSKQFAAHFQSTIDKFKNYRLSELVSNEGNYDDTLFQQDCALSCETEHIDGSMDATEKVRKLAWLREEPEEGKCRILFNVRCLSEGVDVPSLDAVIFFSPRKSQVDVVQIVGRVMRKAPNKRRGYVIIPVVLPGTKIDPSLSMEQNEAFRPVWQVLKALKSIDPELGVDGQLGKIDSDHIEVICLVEDIARKSKKTPPSPPPQKGKNGGGGAGGGKNGGKSGGEQIDIVFGHDEILMENIRALIVKKVGNVREWEDWAEDVGELCKAQTARLRKALDDPEGAKRRKAFDTFVKQLGAAVGETLGADDAVEMLGQHIVTKPVMDALFSEYSFMDQNPISRALTAMIETVGRGEIDRANVMLSDFYAGVRRRAKNVTTVKERQIVVRELFDKFFKFAFPKMRDKLGIVYTPEPVVDFILRSADALLRKEFGASLADEGVHVLDPFTGTGTFILRLIQSGLIPPERLKEKYERELHANEIVPLAYYIASMNVELAYHDAMARAGLDAPYEPNRITVWTDTFADAGSGDRALFGAGLSENNERLAAQRKCDIRVIVSNPPYSAKQESQNDDNQNESYPALDARIAATYAARTNATNKNSLYDSYIRAFRWASDRLGDGGGVIGFVANAGWIDGASADGMRKCLAEEFSSIYVYHLKGDARTSGEQRRRERDNVFGEGSRAPVAIVLLVKNPADPVKGKIYFHAVGDYLTREQKLKELAEARSVENVRFDVLTPDAHGDWLDARDPSFENFMRVDGKRTEEPAIFENYSNGVKTHRDAWAYNSSRAALERNMTRCIENYNAQVRAASGKAGAAPNRDPKLLKWSVGQEQALKAGRQSATFERGRVAPSLYRPFIGQFLYFDPFWNERVYRMPALFPEPGYENRVICVYQNATADCGQIALMVDAITDLNFNGPTQCFPLYLYAKRSEFESGGYERHDAITDAASERFAAAYGRDVAKEDLFYYIYGLLHSPDYRARYANNLSKELPRIPRAATYERFAAFADAGRRLAELHVNYESAAEYPAQVDLTDGVFDRDTLYKVTKMKYARIPGKRGNDALDKTTIVYNGHIRVTGVPLEAQKYVVNKRSALDWVLERADYRVDRESGIVNDFNALGLERNPPDPRYPLSLLLKVITVSVETVKIVGSLPPLEIHPLDLPEGK